VSLDKDYFESVLVMKKRKWREEIFGRRWNRLFNQISYAENMFVLFLLSEGVKEQ
jgi:hypothetical protein